VSRATRIRQILGNKESSLKKIHNPQQQGNTVKYKKDIGNPTVEHTNMKSIEII